MTLVTENELARARNDPAFRQQFLAQNLGRLIEALKKMRRAQNKRLNDTSDQRRARTSQSNSPTVCKAASRPRAA